MNVVVEARAPESRTGTFMNNLRTNWKAFSSAAVSGCPGAEVEGVVSTPDA